jgi:dihydroneopterin aldolase
MDTIFLEGIEVFAYGGVTEHERSIGQHYRMDVVLESDLTLAMRTDSLTDTVSYAEVFQAATRSLRDRPFNLVESAAGRVAAELLDTFDVRAVTVRLCKMLPPVDGVLNGAGAQITVRRDSDPAVRFPVEDKPA